MTPLDGPAAPAAGRLRDGHGAGRGDAAAEQRRRHDAAADDGCALDEAAPADGCGKRRGGGVSGGIGVVVVGHGSSWDESGKGESGSVVAGAGGGSSGVTAATGSPLVAGGGVRARPARSGEQAQQPGRTRRTAAQVADRGDDDGDDQHAAEHRLVPVGLDVVERQRRTHHLEQQHADRGADGGAPAAGERGPAEDHRGDRLERELTADARVAGGDPGHPDEPADAGQRARHHEAQHLGPRRRQPGQVGGLLGRADGVHVAAEAGVAHHERGQRERHEQHDHGGLQAEDLAVAEPAEAPPHRHGRALRDAQCDRGEQAGAAEREDERRDAQAGDHRTPDHADDGATRRAP